MDVAAARAIAAAGVAAAGSLAAAALGTPVSGIAGSSDEDASGGGVLVPCAIAAAIAACAAASVPPATGALLDADAFSVASAAGLLNALVPGLAPASPGLAVGALPEGTAEAPGAAAVPGVARIRTLAACGIVGPEAGTLGAPATVGIVASAPAKFGAAAGSRFAAVKIAAAALAPAGALDPSAIAPVGRPCVLPGGPLTMAAPSATAVLEASDFAGGGACTAGGG